MQGAMRKIKNVHDFGDFEEAINKHGDAVAIKSCDFAMWENNMSTARFRPSHLQWTLLTSMHIPYCFIPAE